ncbi:hypothetical protein X566_17070 [Afipia sp. P52-10]|uniref:hypothetical protein n=1 Tax=Afipia sp. P52-10 TaxID=1429916 RepID=UPI0003DF3886|nr:hypothetical protein [Afipia sp. P52-10]ETR76427.1 hypothetical protein X566_17070 [Afipia sp. P52-10]
MQRLAIAAAFIVLSLGHGLAQGGTYDLTLKVDATKITGSPWDGIPGLGGTRANINGAPDPAVCIVQASSKPQCLWKPQGRRLLSLCQNAHTCKFPAVSLPSPPVGLLFIDIDARRHDLIDIIVLTGNSTAAGEADVELALRSAMETLTPALSEAARERGLHKAKMVPLQQCLSQAGCRLTQSEFKLDLRR